MSAPLEAAKCRTCLQECFRYHELDEYVENNFKIVEMLDEIVPQIHIKIPSQFSYLVCGACVDKLLSGYKFQQLCIQTNMRLHDMLGKARPTEKESDAVVPLAGLDSVPIKQELSDFVIFGCDINPEEITLNLKSNDGECVGGVEIVTGLENAHLPLAGEDSFELKQELKDNIILECDIYPEEITSNLKTQDSWKSVVEECDGLGGGDDRDNESSNENLSILRDRILNTTFDGSEPISISPNEFPHKLVWPCTECCKVFDHLDSLKRHAADHAHLRIHEKETNDIADALGFKSFEKHTLNHTKTQTEMKKNYRISMDMECTNKEQHQMKQDNSKLMEQPEEEFLSVRLTETPDYANDANSTDVDLNTVIKQETLMEQPEEEFLSVRLTETPDYAKDANSTDVDLNTEIKQETLMEQPEEEFLSVRLTETPDYANDANSTDVAPNTVIKQETEIYHHKESEDLFNKEQDSENTKNEDEEYKSCSKTKIIDPENGEIENPNVCNSIRENFPCKICGKVFEFRYREKRHRDVHSLKREHACEFCTYRFSSTIALQIHILQHERYTTSKQSPSDAKLNRHRENMKNHPACHICDKKFKYMSALKGHMLVHTNECSFPCPQCEKSFKTAATLRQHMERHVGLKKYQCTECPSRFNCRSDLTKHMSTHKNRKPHVCDICGSCFTRPYSLRKHKKLHTGKRPYKCSQCNMTFAIRDVLKRHMRTHTGEKPYKCKYCDRAYAESGDLTKHLRTHVGKNTYMCDRCPMAFRYRSELRQHLSEHYKMAQQLLANAANLSDNALHLEENENNPI